MNATDLPAHVARTVRELRLFSPGDTLIVAISGGADSTALLDILAGLSGLKLRLVAAHLNHCLRGTESDQDEVFARTLAERYALPFESRRIDVHELARKQGLNLEDAGRRARIDFLDEVRSRWQATAIALAHHADDQAETVLMRLLRGSGATGLAGMPCRNKRGYIRPLLDITRTEIIAYLSARGLNHREDASNLDTTFLRNRIRHELLPALETYNPAIRACLATTAGLLAEENALLEQLSADAAASACVFNEDLVSCNIGILRKQPQALRRRIFRQALTQLTGSLDHFSHSHIEAIEQLIAAPRPNATLNLPQGVAAVREYDLLTLQRASASATAVLSEIIIEGPGHHALSDGSHLTLEACPALKGHLSFPNDTAYFDLDKVPFPWHVRAYRPGDRMVPLGMSGSKKVKDIFIDDKIPLAQRRQTPLIFSGDSLIWLCGLRSSQLARIDETSARIMKAAYYAA